MHLTAFAQPSVKPPVKSGVGTNTINDTLGAVLKYQDDIARIRGATAAQMLAQVRSELATAGA